MNKCNQALLTSILTDLLNDCLKRGALPATINQRGSHNNPPPSSKRGPQRRMMKCRPITLLNTDHKLLARILAEEKLMKYMTCRFVGPQQTGVVRGRKITDHIRFCQLLQTCMEERHHKGLLLFRDLQKAFDFASHEFQMESLTQRCWSW